MPKITRANIAAARAERDILARRGQEVPERIRLLAELDPDRLPDLSDPEDAAERQNVISPWLAFLPQSEKTLHPSGTRTDKVQDAMLVQISFVDQQLKTELVGDRLVVVDKGDMGTAEELIHQASQAHETHTGTAGR